MVFSGAVRIEETVLAECYEHDIGAEMQTIPCQILAISAPGIPQIHAGE